MGNRVCVLASTATPLRLQMPRASEWDVAEFCPRSCVFLLLSVDKVISLFDKTSFYFLHVSESRLEATHFLFWGGHGHPCSRSWEPSTLNWLHGAFNFEMFKPPTLVVAHLGLVDEFVCVCSVASVRRGLWINAWHLLFVRHLTCLAFFCFT